MKKKKKKRAIKKKQRRMKAKELANQNSIARSHLKVGDKVKHNNHIVIIKEIHAGIADLSDGFGVAVEQLTRVNLN